MYSDSEKTHIINYMERFTQTVSAMLRRYKGRFGPEWNGIDKIDWSMILYFSEDGVHGRIIPKWLGCWVKVSHKKHLADTSLTKYKADIKPDEGCFFSLHVKKTESDGELCVSSQLTGATQIKDFELRILPISGKEATKITLPQVIVLPKGFSRELVQECIQKNNLLEKGIRRLTYPWCFEFFLSTPGLDGLNSFDEDPFIEAHGLVDHFLSVAGLEETTFGSYDQAITELKEAIVEVNTNNEKAIHHVIKKYPFIIVDRHDYSEFESEPCVNVEEQLDQNIVNRKLIPDFVYKLYDERLLVIEIEAASKQLLKQTQETGYQLPRAESVAALFQIHNYKRLFEGLGSRKLRERFKVPDRWQADYLLIIGGATQKDFQQDSWNNLRDFMRSAGVTIKNWDYYLSRLERIKAAGEYRSSE